MSRQVVHDHDVAVREGRREHLLDIGFEGRPVHRAIEDAGRADLPDPEARDKGGGLPVPERLLADHPLARRPAAIKADHFGVGSGLVHEDQLGRVEARLASFPALARFGHVRPVLFGRAQAFF